MKKAFALAAVFALAFSLVGCGGASSAASGAASASASQTETDAEPVELTVFAAASLTETLNQIAEDYKAVAPNVTLTFNFDSSGTLKTQIQEGAVCDVFLSAGQKQMDQLDKTDDTSVNTEGLDFVAEGTRVNLLENKVALCVAEGSDASIASFDDLAKALEGSDILMAMGNSDVPVGQYTQQILTHYGLDEEALANAGKIDLRLQREGGHHPGHRGQRGLRRGLLHRRLQRRDHPRGLRHRGDVRPGDLPRRRAEHFPAQRGGAGLPGLSADRRGHAGV